jgi:hypothetical protein
MKQLFDWFAQPGAADLAHWAISALGLIIAVVAMMVGVLNNRRDRTIQIRLLAIEEERHANQRIETKRAKLRAFLQRSGSQDFRLVIRNDGEAGAWDVRATLDGNPLLEHPIILHGQEEVRKIGPKTEAWYIAKVSFECAPPYELSIQWNDESGEDRTYESTLT